MKSVCILASWPSSIELYILSPTNRLALIDIAQTGVPGLVLALATDPTLGNHCVDLPVSYLCGRYEEGRVEALSAKVLQREKDGTAPARGEYDQTYEELGAAQRNHSESYAPTAS